MANVEKRFEEYRRKRDFGVTPEPSPEAEARRPAEGALFMVHKHHARRLHYDLRLEMDGALASWAIPKGPSYDPAVKRLAVQTEDHPLEYGNFEGRIPDGEYGAGDSLIWDRGVFETIPPGQAVAQREKGHLSLVLEGEKLHGHWHLVRTRPSGGKAQWIFFKAKDSLENAAYDVVAERPESVLTGKRDTRGPGSPPVEEVRREVKLTSPDRVLFPGPGYTKADVFEYYRAVAPAMVRAMDGRPISFQQFPKGIRAPGFFRQAATGAPEWATLVPIRHRSREVKHLVVDRPETLLWLANQSALTLHIWSSRAAHLSEPDWVVFDLDPPKEGSAARAWENLVTVATALRRLLEELGLVSVPKTSGNRGLHVLVPLARGQGHEEARELALAIAGTLEKGLPELVTTERAVKERGGRLYLDPFQNGEGRTLVAPYSIRPSEGATVSTPLRWSEVTPALDPAALTIKTLPARLEAEGDLFAPALEGKQRLPRLR